jgi:hypothetical protein
VTFTLSVSSVSGAHTVNFGLRPYWLARPVIVSLSLRAMRS